MGQKLLNKGILWDAQPGTPLVDETFLFIDEPFNPEVFSQENLFNILPIDGISRVCTLQL